MEEKELTLEEQLTAQQIRKLTLQNDILEGKLIPEEEITYICDMSLLDYLKMRRKYCK